jgi:hypothetical protein
VPRSRAPSPRAARSALRPEAAGDEVIPRETRAVVDQRAANAAPVENEDANGLPAEADQSHDIRHQSIRIRRHALGRAASRPPKGWVEILLLDDVLCSDLPHADDPRESATDRFRSRRDAQLPDRQHDR